VHTLTGFSVTPTAVAFSPDSTTLAVATDNVVQLWHVSDGALIDTLTGHTDTVKTVAFSPDGAVLASAGYDKTIRLWNTQDGSTLHVLTGPELIISTLAFAPDSRTLVTSGWRDQLGLWRVADGALLRLYDAPLGTGVDVLAYSPDGLHLAVGRRDASVVGAHRPPAAGGDLDVDGDVDAADQAVFDVCLAGPGFANPVGGCSAQVFANADLDGDGDVDLADGAILQQVVTGAAP
ncbi:MAG TPA: hypothetical protein P5572_21190, partial [Phycisphaerae bacterium]|nr:hypothetical protein [Phycisphaerae bacterium]